jgi:thiol-disulfide isomerase/thioredoxin
MRANLRANIELAAQVVIAIAVVIAAGVLVKRNVWPAQSSGRLPSINAGERLTLPNVDWARNKKSLVFFLKKDCPYCTSSAGLYRQLVDDATKRNVKSIAVFPNTPEDARKYLQYIELPIENVYTGPLGDYKISGTPTVLFVDDTGIVRSVWIGAQTDREQEMRDKLVALFDS